MADSTSVFEIWALTYWQVNCDVLTLIIFF